jgi:hypothetical protein
VSDYTHDKGRDCRRTDEVLENYKGRAIEAESQALSLARENSRLRAEASALLAERDVAIQERDAERREVERLKREGTPGVMHEVDAAFYRLTVDERNAERHEVDRLRKLLLDRLVVWVTEGDDDG